MLKPPIAKQRPFHYQLHGNTHHDPYAWLRYQEKNPDVISYLEAENAYTDAYMASTLILQETLFNEMRGRIQLADTTVPFQYKDYFYYWRTLENAEYPLLCRYHQHDLEKTEDVLLDENQLAAHHSYFHLGDHAISPNQRYLAYTEDTKGHEEYSAFIMDLDNRELLPLTLHTIGPHVLWAEDNITLFYIKLDNTCRPYQLWAYHLPTQTHQLYYTETDVAFSVHVYKSKNDQFILLETGSKTTNEIHIINAFHPSEYKICFYPRRDQIFYELIPHEHTWYIRTNEKAKNFTLCKMDIDNILTADVSPEKWKTLIAHRMDVKLEAVEIFRDFLVVTERREAHLQLCVVPLATPQDPYIPKVNEVTARRQTASARSVQPVHEDVSSCSQQSRSFIHEGYIVNFPEDAYTVETIDNYDFNSHLLRILYTSLTTPRTIYDIDLHTHQHHCLKETPVLGQFNKNDYTGKRLYAMASDGTKIPISLVYRNTTPLDGTAPLYLYGYGSYGLSMDPWFSSSRLSLLDRGYIFAIAHIRGGGDNGEFWYEAGKLLHKKNTFTDFITCADFLVQEKYTSHPKTIIAGGSAGGLLIGAVINMRPDIASVAIAQVPFVDVLNTMLDPSIPLTTAEYVEWGNPEEAEYYEYINSYAPYENVREQDYPALWVTAGLQDPRVHYWEPAKWVAKLRAYKTDDRPLLLHTNMTAGHKGASGRFAALKELALEYAFILKEI